MKILHINWSGNLGGAENFAFQLAKAQKAYGYEVTIAYMVNRSIIGDQAIKSGINAFECNMKNGSDFINLGKCFNLIKKENFDVIHNHNGSPFLNLIRCISPRSILINHLHGTSLGNDRWVKKSILIWHKISSFLVDHYVANSNHTKKIVMNKYRLPDHRISVLYNGIALKIFRPTEMKTAIKKEFGVKDNDNIVGTVARLAPPKGIDKFIEVAKRVTEEIDNVKFFIVGEGELRPILERKVIKLNLQDKVIFTGARTDVPNLLSIFDIFLLTSNREAFGITLLEAMAIGVPIITFAVDGVKEVVNEHCAILIPPGDTESMAYHVLSLLRDKRKQRDLSKNGLIHVKKFNIETVSKKTIQIYQSLSI